MLPLRSQVYLGNSVIIYVPTATTGDGDQLYQRFKYQSTQYFLENLYLMRA